MELENEFRYLVGGYYGVALMDEYPVKEFILKDIEEYIKNFVKMNPIEHFDYQQEAMMVKDHLPDKTKLQDALIVLNRINGPMDLIFMIKARLNQLKNSK